MMYLNDGLITPMQVETTAQGYLKLKARLATICINEYQHNGLTLRGFRNESIFSTSHMESVAASPMTNGHPTTKEKGKDKRIFIDATNTKKYQVGFPMGSPWRDEKYLLAWLMLTDSKAIKDYYAGKNKISLGGICNPRFIKGEWGGDPYDFLIDDPVNNHIAMCYIPRSEDYNLRMGIMDSIDDSAPEPDPEPKPEPKEPKKMALLKLGNQQVDIDDNAHAVVSTYIAGLETSLAESKKNAERFEALFDSKEQELKSAQAASENISYQKFMEFSKLMDAAKTELPKKLFDSIDFEKGFEPVAVKKMILSNKYPSLSEKYEKQSDTYIETAYESFMDFKAQNSDQKHTQSKDFGKEILDSKDDEDTQSEANQAFLKQMERSRNLWKQK